MGLLAAAAGPAMAQSPPGAPTPGPTIPERIEPEPRERSVLPPEGTPRPGVIPPPPGIDPGIQAPVPVPRPNTTPVIPPPGTPDGAPAPRPR